MFFLISTWATIAPLDSDDETARIATNGDPSVAVADVIIVGARLACLAAVGLVLIRAAHSGGTTKALLIYAGHRERRNNVGCDPHDLHAPLCEDLLRR